MLAAVYHGQNDFRLEDVPIPEIGMGEILVKVTSAGICGTDLRILRGEHRLYPTGTIRIPGHEVVGTVAVVGEDVQGYSVGEHVFCAPNTGCGHCTQCISGNNNLCAEYNAIGITMDGAFAEFIRIPASLINQGNLIPIHEKLDPAVAALVEPFACVVRGQRPLHIQPGEVVLIMGAGPIGEMHMKLARTRGAGCIIVSEPRHERAQLARKFGADRIVDPFSGDLRSIVLAESHGRGADVIIVATDAHSAQETALDLAAISGRINYFGALPKNQPTIRFYSNFVHYKELVVTATSACSTSDCLEAARLVDSGLVNLADMISYRFPLKDALQAFALAGEGRALKIILEP